MHLKKLSINGFFVFLVITVCILQPVQAQYTADGENFTLVSPIRINSPSNATYTTNQVHLNVTVKTFVNCHINNMTLIYSLDKKDNVTIPLTPNDVVDVKDIIVDDDGRGLIFGGGLHGLYVRYVVDVEDFVDVDEREVINLIIGTVNLENLQNGSHSLTVYGIYSTHQSQKIGYDKQTVYFTTGSEKSVSEPRDNTLYGVAVVLLLVTVVLCVLLIKFKHRVKHGQ